VTTRLLRIPVEIELTKGHRNVRLKGIADTGASGYLVIAREAVESLGLELTNPHESGGVVEGAKIRAWNAIVDGLEIVGNPDCFMDHVRIEVAEGYARTPGEEEFLLGEDFFRSLNAVIEYSHGGVSIRCRPTHVSLTPALIGGGFLAAAIMVAVLTWDS
jgi:hypothetical protein